MRVRVCVCVSVGSSAWGQVPSSCASLRTNYTNVDSASSWAAKTKAIWKFTTFYSHYTLRRLRQATPILACAPPPPSSAARHVNFAYNFRTTFGFSLLSGFLFCLLYANFPSEKRRSNGHGTCRDVVEFPTLTPPHPSSIQLSQENQQRNLPYRSIAFSQPECEFQCEYLHYCEYRH